VEKWGNLDINMKNKSKTNKLMKSWWGAELDAFGQSVINGLIVDFVFYSFFYIASSHMGLDVITNDD
jgi:hypothetical protein